jgi:hypothetical protein
METQRLILFAIFFTSAFFLWERWQETQRPPVPPAAKVAQEPAAPPLLRRRVQPHHRLPCPRAGPRLQ